MTTYAVRVRPGASRTRVGGGHGEPPALVIAVTDPAIDGRANAAALRALADALGVRPPCIELVSGHGARTKVVRIVDPPDDIDVRWSRLLDSP